MQTPPRPRLPHVFLSLSILLVFISTWAYFKSPAADVPHSTQGVTSLACPSPASHREALVLKYDDFGPPSMAWELIGQAWYQWQPQGDPSRHTPYDIRVIVYSGTSQGEVQAIYPINPEQQCDYRFVARDEAIAYLEARLSELEAIEDVSTRDTLKQLLAATRQKIHAYFASKPPSPPGKP